MFDIGFSELIVIAVVALVVIGPERLPKVARTIGHLLGKAQRYVNDVKTEINREMEIDELRRLQAEMQEAARNLETNVHQTMRETEVSVQQSVKAIEEDVAMKDPIKLDPSDYNPAEKDGPILLSDSDPEPEPDKKPEPQSGAVESPTQVVNHSANHSVTQIATQETTPAGPQKS